MENCTKFMEKWLKVAKKKWSKIEKNQLLFGENIKFHSKNVCFLLKNYRRTRKNVQNS